MIERWNLFINLPPNSDINVPESSTLVLVDGGRCGAYVERMVNPDSFTRAELVALAAAGKFVGTFTRRIGTNVDVTVELRTLPAAGIHFLQTQNPEGFFSNDFIFFTD